MNEYIRVFLIEDSSHQAARNLRSPMRNFLFMLAKRLFEKTFLTAESAK
jgi:hypothetical protein